MWFVYVCIWVHDVYRYMFFVQAKVRTGLHGRTHENIIKTLHFGRPQRLHFADLVGLSKDFIDMPIAMHVESIQPVDLDCNDPFPDFDTGPDCAFGCTTFGWFLL